MQAVILVGGQGTRLRPLTATRPKPMMPLVDRPFVEHQIAHLVRYGIHDIVFSCGYRPDALEAYFGDGTRFGVRLRYVTDPIPLGTAGAVANAVPAFDHPDDVLVLNGDILTDLDLEAFRQAHVAAGAEGSIALTPVTDPSAYGLVRLRENRAVAEFLEKPSVDDLIPGEPYLINAGTYLLSQEVIATIPSDRACSIEREIFPVLAERGTLFGYPSNAYWRDIGTPQSYLEAHHDMLAGAVSTADIVGDVYLGPGTIVQETARVADRSLCRRRLHDRSRCPGARQRRRRAFAHRRGRLHRGLRDWGRRGDRAGGTARGPGRRRRPRPRRRRGSRSRGPR